MPGLPKSGSDERRSQPQSYYRVLAPKTAIFSFTGSSATRGMVYLLPFEVPQRMTINKFSLPIVTGGGSGYSTRAALYLDNGDTPVGGSKVADSGNVGVNALTSGTFAYNANPGMYWLAITFSTNAVQYARAASLQSVTSFCGASFSYASGFSGSLYTKSTALPSTCPAVTIPVSTAQYSAVLT